MLQFMGSQRVGHGRATELNLTNSWSLLKLVSIESVMPFNHLVFCHHLLSDPSIFPSIRVLSSESAFHNRWLKYWSFSISSSNEYSQLISFRIDWFDFLAVQGTLRILWDHLYLNPLGILFKIQSPFAVSYTGFNVDIWQNQYNIVKLKNKIK